MAVVKLQKGKSVKVIRHVYLYLVTLIGLITFVMGAVGIINNGLQRYVFKVDQIENFGPVAVYPGYQDQCSMAYPDPKDKEGKTTITPTSQETADCRAAAQEQSRHFSDAQFAREISVYKDKTFTFIMKTPPASILILKALGLAKGSGEPNKNKIGTLTKAQLREIAEKKMPDLNCHDIEAAMKTVAGTARNMGVSVEA